MSYFYSPLRYPGGKKKLANFIKLTIIKNELYGSKYIEPYAGGSAVGLELLIDELSSKIILNDINPSIYSFWRAVISHTEQLCRRIYEAKLDMDEWHKQCHVQHAANPNVIDLAFSTFYLNRTNRSGIISGGVIGGKNQNGKWKMDARFNKPDLINRIERIARYRSRITLYNIDAHELISQINNHSKKRVLFYLDPPYYVKGGELYINHYQHSDHVKIRNLVSSLKHPWLLSYDNVDNIKRLYDKYNYVEYGIKYSAQDRYEGSEVLYYSPILTMPDINDPSRINKKEYHRIKDILHN